MTRLLFVIGMPNVTHRPWNIGEVDIRCQSACLCQSSRAISRRVRGNHLACGANAGVVVESIAGSRQGYAVTR